MIVPMKKVHVVGLSAQHGTMIDDLKDLGLLHVGMKILGSPAVEALRQEQGQVRKALVLATQVVKKGESLPPPVVSEAGQVVEILLGISEELKAVDDQAEKLHKEMKRLEPWGDFDPQTLKELVDQGLAKGIWTVPTSDLAKDMGDARWVVAFANKAKTGILVLPGAGELPRSAEPFEIPEEGLHTVNRRLKELQEQRQGLMDRIRALGQVSPLLEDQISRVDLKIEEALVKANVDDKGEVCLLEGYVPVPQVPSLKDWAAKQSWGLVIQEPSREDQVPTLLKNPKPVRMLKPILQFLGTTPGYYERDISHWFLIFLTIFFAMIIGDAVYGLLMLALATFFGFRIKASGKPMPLFIPLLITFSLATVAWGTMTGTWLGLSDAYLPSWLKALKVPFLTDPEMGTKNVQLLCFVMGLGHLLLAHILRFFKELRDAPHIHAFAQLGWAGVLFGSFWLVLNLVLDPVLYPIPPFAIWFIGGGMAMVFLFEKQDGGNFFKGVISALANVITTALSGVSAFSDIISYIRLFAVGLAGLAIAQSFNSMAEGIAQGGGASLVAGALIMFFGHTLNLIMGALSVVVHGVRLNMLEYSSHIGLEWTGIDYKPFKQEV